MEKVLFKEEQRFTQRWLWVLIIVSFWFPMFFLGYKLIDGWGNGPDRNLGLLFVFLIVLVSAITFTWLFNLLKLVTEIGTDKISFKFSPFHLKWRYIRKEEIEKFEVRNYKPVAEYGGWGIKGGSKNKAYNVSGNTGLQLYLKNGKRVLFGTQKKQAIEHAMNKLVNKETGNQNGKGSL